jgi:hypothetical protein
MNMFRRAHDPWWDLEGQGAKRSRIRHKIVADIAFALAIVACGITAAAWLLTLAPIVGDLGLG